MVSGSRTMHPQSPPLTIGGTALKESDDLVILGVTFYFIPGECSKIDHFVGDASGVLSCPFWSTFQQCAAGVQIHI